MSESAIARRFAALRAAGQTALIPFLTAGYPDRTASLTALQHAGALADIVEVGVPFSDPLADGPTIQRASFEALRGGMTVAGSLALIAEAAVACPVVVFSYLNPILRYGVDRFVRDAAAAGASGLLLTDLPVGADPPLEQSLRDGPLDLVRLVAPTSTPERIRETVAGARGFVYLVSRLGVTGASSTLSADLSQSVARVRSATTLPVAVGFGISRPEHAAAVARLADGVVIGSELVERQRKGGPEAVKSFLREVRSSLDAVDKRAPRSSAG